MQYFVVYRDNDIIHGPLSRGDAMAMAEDLDFALEDPNYKAISEEEMNSLHLSSPETEA